MSDLDIDIIPNALLDDACDIIIDNISYRLGMITRYEGTWEITFFDPDNTDLMFNGVGSSLDEAIEDATN